MYVRTYTHTYSEPKILADFFHLVERDSKKYRKEVAAQKYVIFDEKLGKWMKYSGKMLIVCLPLLTQNTKVGGT